MMNLNNKRWWKYTTLSIMVLFILSSCSNIDCLFDSKNIEKGIQLEKLDESVSEIKSERCKCDLYYDNVIRLSKHDYKNHLFLVRDYFGVNFFSIGKIKDNNKIGIWYTYCQDVKVMEEYWNNGNLIWISKFDQSGKVIETVHLGINPEDF